MLSRNKCKNNNRKCSINTSIKDLTIGVFRGGVSSERGISLLSGQNVIEALKKKGYKVKDVDLQTRDESRILNIIKANAIDIVFITLHGEFGEDGGIQKIFEANDIPFTGAGSHSSFLAMDKIETLTILRKNNIPVPSYWLYGKSLPNFSESDFPLVVKPHSAGSSIGVSIVREKSYLDEAIRSAQGYSSRVLIERYIGGRELTVGIVGKKILPIVEMAFRKDFFDFSCKYDDNLTEFIVPAELPQDTYTYIQNLALRVYTVLGCRHFGRIDLRIDNQLHPYILELNSIPGLTSHSLLPLAARVAGLDFPDLCEEILKAAVQDYA